MDNDAHELIAPPCLIRERLARNYEDADLLRRLLKLAVVAAERDRLRKYADHGCLVSRREAERA